MLDGIAGLEGVDRFVEASGSHPLPDAASVRAGDEALEAAADARRQGGGLIVLLSGGASAMLASPIEGVSLDDKREITRRLQHAGADIGELNAVRRHLSRVKGGRLALDVPCLTFAISDVTTDDPATIGSGPTSPDPSSIDEAIGVIEHRGIAHDVPHVIDAMRAAGETPKPGDARLAQSHFVLIGGRRTAMDAVATRAIEAGLATVVFDEPITGPAADAGAAFVQRALASTRRLAGAPVVVIASGETTVLVRGDGVGGRNQEFALGAARELARMARDGTSARTVRLAALGTDGVDGASHAAGAVVDNTTEERAAVAGYNASEVLAHNDTTRLFESLGDLIVTGPTGTNVGDVFVAMIGP